LAFLIFASLILVLAIQTTGVLLVTSLLVFPILTLHPWVNTPEQLCVYASGLGVVSVWGGFALSLLLNVAPGPLMTVFLLCCFVLSRFFSSLYQRHAKI
jgi:zinc transport system permease protein